MSFSSLLSAESQTAAQPALPFNPTGFGDVVADAFDDATYRQPYGRPAFIEADAAAERDRLVRERFGQDPIDFTGVRKDFPELAGAKPEEVARRLDELVLKGRESEPEKWQGIRTTEEIEAITRDRAQTARLKFQETAAKAGPVAQAAGAFVGAIGGAFTDPINLATLPFGAGAGMGILRAAATEGLINAGIEAAEAPFVAQWQRELGFKYGLEEAALDIGTAGVGGAVLSTVIRGTVPAARGLKDLAGSVSMRVLDKFSRSESLPAEVRGAAQYMSRVAHVDEEMPPSAGAVREDLASHRATVQETQDAIRNYREPVYAEGTPASRSIASDAGGAAMISPRDTASVGTQALPSQPTERADPSGNFSTATMNPSTLAGDSRLGSIEKTPSGGSFRVYQSVNDVKSLVREAARLEGPLKEWLGAVTQDVQGVSLYGVRVKERKSASTKVERAGREPRMISDYLGGRFVADSPRAIRDLTARLQQSARVVSVDDFLDGNKNGGYRAVHLNLATKDGFSYEVQILPKEIADVYDKSRALYEKWKELRGKYTKEQEAEAAADMAESRRLFDEAWARFEERNRASGIEPQLREAGLSPEDAAASAGIVRPAMDTLLSRYGGSEALRKIIERRFGGLRVERGTGNEGDLFQSGNAPAFYSALERSLTDLPQGKGSPEQWAGIVKNLTQKGVKQEEIDWLGIQDWLKQQKGTVTKEQVLDYVRANQVEVEEVVKGGEDEGPLSWSIEGREDDGFYAINDETGERITEVFDNRYDAEAAAEELSGADRFGDDTKFSQYTLPGGQNYRELLITLPFGENTSSYKTLQAERDSLRHKLLGDTLPSGKTVQQRLDEIDQQSENIKSSAYTSSHFDEPNVVAHLRFNERTDADGKRVMFIEEVQSDWHQQGREKGYKVEKSEGRERRIAEIEAEFAEWQAANPGINSSVWRAENPDLVEEARSLDLANNPNRVPEAPFKTSWPELAFKRALMWAAENKFDRVAWTTGAQQAERYDLSKQVDAIEFRKGAKSGDYDIRVKREGRSETLPGVQREGDYHVIEGGKLSDMIGKEAAQKVTERAEQLKGGAFGSLSGVDLRVGGEGMKAFYDKMLPSMVNKLTKKWGGKVEAGAVVPEGSVRIAKSMNAADKAEYLADIKERGGVHDVHVLSITPAMRESVMKGLPLFQDNRGSISFLDDASVIRLMEKSDLSTFLHETGHFYWSLLSEMAAHPEAPDGLRADWQAVRDWVKAEEGKPLTVEQEEKIARGFEQYLREGKAPSAGLKAAFAKFKKWLTDIYRAASDLGVEINDEVRGVFGRLLATDEQIAATRAEDVDLAKRPANAAESLQQAAEETQASRLTETESADFARLIKEKPDMKLLVDGEERTLQELADEIAEGETILLAIRTCGIG